MNFNYDSANIHYKLLNDSIRTVFYRKAIKKYIKTGDIVADLGCGTGILSFFASKSGAKKIYAIDKMDIIKTAKKVADLNEIKNIEFIQKDMFDVEIEAIDVIIQEQIGSFFWDEDMILKVSHYRDRFLKKGGVILPGKVSLYLVPIYLHSEVEISVQYWKHRPYGFNMNQFALLDLKQNINHNKIKLLSRDEKIVYLDTPQKVTEVDFYTVNPKERLPIIKTEFSLSKGDIFSGFLGYFSLDFDEKISFNSSYRDDNNWNQFFIGLDFSIDVTDDSVLNFEFQPAINKDDWKYQIDIVKI
ncbi:50S ribosomal protein L11 methyltransferase [bacterium]|nr:50S ribosomal protein L11 methyltransferase [bacterium]